MPKLFIDEERHPEDAIGLPGCQICTQASPLASRSNKLNVLCVVETTSPQKFYS